VTKEKVAEIATEFMTTFYGIQVGALETQEFRTDPVPFWLVAFSDSTKGLIHQLYFVVVLPNGNVIEPKLRHALYQRTLQALKLTSLVRSVVLQCERDSFARRNFITIHKTTCIFAQAISNFIRATVQPEEIMKESTIVIVTPVGIVSSRVAAPPTPIDRSHAGSMKRCWIGWKRG
jgi:hypothetical protein